MNLTLQISIDVLRTALVGLADQVARHNIEEFGNLEFILPGLYRQYNK